jgi:hypothetical protein
VTDWGGFVGPITAASLSRVREVAIEQPAEVRPQCDQHHTHRFRAVQIALVRHGVNIPSRLVSTLAALPDVDVVVAAVDSIAAAEGRELTFEVIEERSKFELQLRCYGGRRSR